MQTQKEIQTQDWIIFFSLSFIWGFSFFFMKKGLEAFHPFQVAAFRMTFAFVAFIPFFFLYRKKLVLPKNKIKFIPVLALLGNLLPAICFCIAETELDSAIASIENSTTPIFTLFIGSLFFGIPLNRNRVLGIIIGFIGVCTIILAEAGTIKQNFSYHVFLPILATCFYGTNANIFKKYFQGENPVVVALWQYAFAFLICFPYLLFSGVADIIKTNTTLALSSIFYLMILGIFGTAIAQIYFNKLAQRTSALFVTLTTFVIPLVSIFIGFFVGEKIMLLHIIGLLIILSGIYSVVKIK